MGRHTGDGRGVYRQRGDEEGGAGKHWMWWHKGDWNVSGNEKNVGTGACGLYAKIVVSVF